MQTYTHYKDSGIDWIGQIPEHWSISKLKYSGNSIIGLTYSPNDLCNEDEGTLVCRSSNIKDGKLTFNDNVFVKSKISEKLKLLKNDILICSRNGSRELIGKCALVEKQYPNLSFGAFTTVYRTMFYRFIYYYFNSPIFKSYSGSFLTSTINQLTTGNLNSFILTLPPIHEQEAIANFLDDKTAKIDALVQTKEQQIEKLKELRQAKIHQAVTKGLDANAPTKDSGVPWIGEIPAHWEVKRLKNVGEFINGYAFNSESFLSEGIKVMKISNIQTMKTDWSDLSCVDVKYFEALEKFRVLQGDLVFALTRPIISTGIKATIVFENEKILINQRNAILRTKGDFDIKWLYYIILDSSFIQEFDNQIDKTGQQPNISTYNIGNISIPFPRKKDIEQIVTYLDEVTGKIDQAIAQKQEQITQLKAYKQSLINNVVTGKVKVC